MKTAVSIPDELFEAAERLAEREQKSRSKLYADALADYVRRRRDEEIRRKLDEVYGEVDSTPDEFMREAARQAFARTEW